MLIPIRSSRSAIAGVLELVAVAVVYYAAARLSLYLAFQHTNASPVWPPSGIALAAVLLRGYRVWPGILVGAFCANAVVFLANDAATMSTIVGVSTLIALGNTLEALTGAILLHRVVGKRSPLDRAADVFKFVAVVLAVCALAGTIGATSLYGGGIISAVIFKSVWFTWWLGDAAGILVITPVLLVWCTEKVQWNARRTLEAVLLLGLLGAAGLFVFTGENSSGPLAYALIPIVVVAAFRYGKRGVVLAILIASGLAIWGTIHDHGPFAAASVNDQLLLLQVFVAIVTMTGLILTATLTERAHAEQATLLANANLERHAEQLQAANKELEAFAYSVSHDLRTPLRSIDGFSKALIEDYADKLDDAGQEMLGRVGAASQRMAQLIDDMLTLSRLTRAEMHCERVDLGVLADEIIGELRAHEPARQVTFTKAADLVVAGDKQLLRVALENLLGNAWKFAGKKPRATIEMGLNRDHGTAVYFVRDNGAGFDMAYVSKLFGAFQRLHSMEEFPGTGIGLATVQRVVHRHGGRVWAEGKVERGATIYFTLGGTERPTIREE